MNTEEAKHYLSGPIASVRVPFDRDGCIDFRGLSNQVEFDIEAGARTVMLTAGDSHYFCLTPDEIAEVTKTVVQQVGGRSLVVAADCQLATAGAISFARLARDAGADIVMCLPPDWASSTTPQSLAEHYSEVGKVLPVMIVTGVFIPRGIDFGLKTIELSLTASQNIVAIKDDMCGEFAPKLCLLAYERCAIIAGGQKVNHLNMYPYGCDGYLSTLLTFRPEVAQKYWESIETGDLVAARTIVRDLDMPLFDFLFTLPGDFDAGVHGMLELFGLSSRYRRPPYVSLSDQDMEKLSAFLKSKNLGP